MCAYKSSLLSSSQPYESKWLTVLCDQGNSQSNDPVSSSTVQFVSRIVNLFTCFTANVTVRRLTVIQETLGRYLLRVIALGSFSRSYYNVRWGQDYWSPLKPFDKHSQLCWQRFFTGNIWHIICMQYDVMLHFMLNNILWALKWLKQWSKQFLNWNNSSCINNIILTVLIIMLLISFQLIKTVWSYGFYCNPRSYLFALLMSLKMMSNMMGLLKRIKAGVGSNRSQASCSIRLHRKQLRCTLPSLFSLRLAFFSRLLSLSPLSPVYTKGSQGEETVEWKVAAE